MAKNNKGNNRQTKTIFAVKLNPVYVNVAMTIVLAAVIICLLAVVNANYMRKIEALSLFVPTHDYYIECMRLPGGCLTWVSTFLTQTFYHPWLGAVVYAALLMVTVLAAYRAFRLPIGAYSALLVIPCAILLALLNLGYVIFSLKSPGYAFLLPVGTLCVVLAFWGYRCFKLWWLRLIAIAFIAVCGYAAAGFYALLTAGICAVFEIASMLSSGSRWWQRLAIVAVGGLCIWLMPGYWVMHVDTDVPLAFIYSCPLPRFYDGESSLYVPYIVVSLSLMLLAVLAAVAHAGSVSHGSMLTAICAGVGVVSLICVFVCRYDDSNFWLTLDLDRGLWDQQWQRTADRMAEFGDEPTRLNVMLSDMALLRTGQAADKIFAYPIGAATYNTARDLRATHDAGSMMFSYHMGLINYAYRWAMENKVEYGTNVEQLKFMVKCALLNGDYDVARKCIDTLRLTAFHGGWAVKYAAYLDDPSLIDNDAEMSAVRALITDDNMFIDDQGQLEGYVWPKLANALTGSREVLELSLISALVCHDLEAFARRLPYYAQLNDRLPRHFQEGILMWSRVHENAGFRQFNIDREVKDRFKSFLIAQKQYSGMPLESQAELMRPAYGDTYWYYCLYVRNLKII